MLCNSLENCLFTLYLLPKENAPDPIRRAIKKCSQPKIDDDDIPKDLSYFERTFIGHLNGKEPLDYVKSYVKMATLRYIDKAFEGHPVRIDVN
jgi:hypothetical protein